jgi:CheY-like chemotaxis protein
MEADPLKVLGRLRSRNYDLIITDLGMPKIHGIELIAKIRKICGWC